MGSMIARRRQTTLNRTPIFSLQSGLLEPNSKIAGIDRLNNRRIAGISGGVAGGTRLQYDGLGYADVA